MVVEHDVTRDAREIWEPIEELSASEGMCFHLLHLAGRQWSRLKQDRVRHPDLPQIVKEKPILELRIRREFGSDSTRQAQTGRTHPLGVIPSLIVTQLERTRERPDRHPVRGVETLEGVLCEPTLRALLGEEVT
jgi:hypothetical protein